MGKVREGIVCFVVFFLFVFILLLSFFEVTSVQQNKSKKMMMRVMVMGRVIGRVIKWWPAVVREKVGSWEGRLSLDNTVEDMMKKRVNLWDFFVFYYLFVCNTIYHFITVELRLLLYIASVSILYRLCGFVSFYTNDKNNILGGKEKMGKWVRKVGKVG